MRTSGFMIAGQAILVQFYWPILTFFFSRGSFKSFWGYCRTFSLRKKKSNGWIPENAWLNSPWTTFQPDFGEKRDTVTLLWYTIMRHNVVRALHKDAPKAGSRMRDQAPVALKNALCLLSHQLHTCLGLPSQKKEIRQEAIELFIAKKYHTEE